MRILHLIKNFDFGGAENHVCELANSLDALGHDIFIITEKGRQVSRLNKRIRFIPLCMKDSLLPFQVIIICYLALKNKIQIIHAHQRLPILIANIVGIITGIPVVVTVHGRTRYDLRSAISRNNPSKLIFVSRHVLEISAKFEEIKHKSVVIPNGVIIRKGLSCIDPFSISYISRLDRKHSSLVMMIIKEVIYPLTSDYPMITFNIIGEGEFLPEIKKEAEKLNFRLKREVCICWGFVPDAKDIIRRSGLVLGVGRVALEAIACGIPVLSINNKHLGTIISKINYSKYKDNNFVAVEDPPPDQKKLFCLLNDYFAHPPYRKNESVQLQKLIDRDFNPEKHTLAITDLYAESFKSAGI